VKKISKALLSALVPLLAFASLPASSFAQTAHGIASVVNDDIITTYDLRQRALFMMAIQGIQQPTEEDQQRLLGQALRNLVDEKLQMQEAQKFSLTISDEAVLRGVERILSRNGVQIDAFAQQLASAGISIGTMQDQVRSDTAWQRIIGGLYGDRIRISDAQIDETLNRIIATADKPSYRISEIYIEATPDIGGMEGAMQGGTAMIEQLKQGAPFPVLAQQFSSAPSAAKGGDIGWIREGELREELNAVIVQMEEGTVSNPIAVPGGVYVVALLGKQVSESETFYTLRQINYQFDDEADLPSAQLAIGQASAAIQSCGSLENDIKAFDGIATVDMGEIKSADLSAEILDTLSKTDEGSVSEPLSLPNTLVSLMVCKRELRGSNIPSRDEVENNLLSQQEAQISRRHLRDLRRNATIVTR